MRVPLLAILGSAIGHAPGVVIGPSLDAAVFAVVGRELARGYTPYVEVWDHKPPVIYLLDAAAAFAGPAQWAVVWLASVAACAVIGVLAARVLRPLATRPIPSIMAFAAALLSGQYLLSLGGGLTEPFAAALAAFAVVLALASTRPRSWILVGVVLGIAILASPQVVPALPAVALIGVRHPDGWGARLLALIAGGAAVVAAVSAALVATGAFAAATEALLIYNGAYRVAADRLGSAFGPVPWTVLAVLPLIAPAVIGVARLRSVPGAMLPGLAAVAWIVGAMLMTPLQGRFYAHYAIAAVFPLAILAGIGLHDLFSSDSSLRRRVGTVAAAGILMIWLPAAVVGAAQEATTWARENDRSARVADAVQARSDPMERIFVWGNGPWVYLDADRRPASRFTYLLPLVTPGFVDGRLVAAVTEELEVSLPAVVVDTGGDDPVPGFPSLDADLAAHPLPEAALLQPLKWLIRERYTLVDTVDGWSIYALDAR